MVDAIIVGPREEPQPALAIEGGPTEEIEDEPDVIDADVEINAVEIEDAGIRVEATGENLMNADPRAYHPGRVRFTR